MSFVPNTATEFCVYIIKAAESFWPVVDGDVALLAASDHNGTSDLQLTAEWWWPASINIYWYSGDCHPKGLGFSFFSRLNFAPGLSGSDDIPINQCPTWLTIPLFYDSLFLLCRLRTAKAKRVVHTLRVEGEISVYPLPWLVTHKFNKSKRGSREEGIRKSRKTCGDFSQHRVIAFLVSRWTVPLDAYHK